MNKRIVVTGMGIVSPLGSGCETVWQRLLAGRSGIARLGDEYTLDIACKVGGMVPDFDPALAVEPKDQKKMDRFALFALAAAREALDQAGWHPATEEERLRSATIANMAASHISIQHGLRGPLGAPITACAAGAQAIGDAARLIRSGEADIAVCGGAEACVDRVSLGSFAAMRALSTGFNDVPASASRPFDQARDGFVMGEGAGIIVIEELEHALRRGAVPLAELVGYGTTADAYHMTSPPDDGAGGRRAMALAIRQGGVPVAAIGHLNAHATSTPVGDAGELAAIRAVFGADGGPAISATKSATGHLLGAAGGVEAIFTIQALRDQMAPATLNLAERDAAADGLDIVAGAPRPLSTEYAMSNAFGFGGVNASLLFRRWQS